MISFEQAQMVFAREEQAQMVFAREEQAKKACSMAKKAYQQADYLIEFSPAEDMDMRVARAVEYYRLYVLRRAEYTRCRRASHEAAAELNRANMKVKQ